MHSPEARVDAQRKRRGAKGPEWKEDNREEREEGREGRGGGGDGGGRGGTTRGLGTIAWDISRGLDGRKGTEGEGE